MPAPASLYDILADKVESLGVELDITYYKYSLAAPANASTGWYVGSYAAGTPLEMILIGRGAQDLLTGSGVYVKLDVAGFTKTEVYENDKVLDSQGNIYIVKTVTPHPIGDVTVFYESQMNRVYVF